jgi:tetratricopeptide (TPR) repeat protein
LLKCAASSTVKKLALPPSPECLTQRVKAWSAPVALPTYEPLPPDKNPMFLEKRVYQGSSGRVYPLPFIDRISSQPLEREWEAVHLENEFVRVMVLPEIGGRIHVGLDKTNGYDFFYRQNVIRPALVGLAGPWISGGVEFNWPQHHRPATFMPVQTQIEEHPDGSVTIWCSDHDPINRMKGMHGVCLHPGKAYIELKVRVYNRTALAQTFLWWANVATRVHEQYLSFFPPDVAYVADHARRAMSKYPLCEGSYYGVDYGARAFCGVPEGSRPRQFVPPGTYAANDLRWYSNIPVPTSYMAMGSNADFFGGYDNAQKAGLIHIADRHIAPGKKQWTWGNHDFGYAWDRNLTDQDGPYIELMAGVYTDNQPDFSWLQPYETRTWSQFWYPIQEIGPAKKANRNAALNLEQSEGRAKLGLCVTELFAHAMVTLTANGKQIFEETLDLVPGRPILRELAAAGEVAAHVVTSDGKEIIAYAPEKRCTAASLPEPATEPPAPNEIDSADELYITGLHLEQYRHATHYPEPYWEEALRRDPLDSRCNAALGLIKLRRGQLAEAEQHCRQAIERLVRRNANPLNGDAHYYLGVTLQYQGRLDEAYDAHYKAVWNYEWQAAGFYHLAEIDCRRRNFSAALDHLDRSLAVNTDNLKARDLKASILRLNGHTAQAEALARETVAMDPLDLWSLHELVLLSPPGDKLAAERRFLSLLRKDVQLHLDLALDYASSGMWIDARAVLSSLAAAGAQDHPIALYALASFAEAMGDPQAAAECREKAANAPSDYCFPARIEEMLLLQRAIAANPKDSKAHYYLGNLYYDKKRYQDAISAWDSSVELDAAFSIPWRNLGIAYFNVLKDKERSLQAYRQAFAANPADARLLYELDQLLKRTGDSAESRIAFLEMHFKLVEKRDDMMVEFITLCNQTGQSQRALELLLARRFSPWEGGEGLVSGQYVWAHFLLGRSLLESEQAEQALRHFEAARRYPENLGEGKHLLTSEVHLDYFTGLALQRLGQDEKAAEFWAKAVAANPPFSWMTYFQARALNALGRDKKMDLLVRELRSFAVEKLAKEITIDYFATSLPNLLLFEDDLQQTNQIDCLFLKSLADAAEGKFELASAEFKEVLMLDPNHLAAQEELRALNNQLSSRRPCDNDRV